MVLLEGIRDRYFLVPGRAVTDEDRVLPKFTRQAYSRRIHVGSTCLESGPSGRSQSSPDKLIVVGYT